MKDEVRGFVLSQGRSGTQWLAKTLSACTELQAYHETCSRFLHRLHPFGQHVEVNSFLWDRVQSLSILYPQAVTIHLVRDGRDVVRSDMTRNQAKGKSFVEACEDWALKNDYLAREHSHFYRLEELVEPSGELEALATELGAQLFRYITIPPQNVTRQYTFPSWTEWDSETRRTFDAVCGQTMVNLGYY